MHPNGRRRDGAEWLSSDTDHYKSISRWYGTSLFAAGAIITGIGAYMFFTGKTEIAPTETVFVPTLLQDGAGFAAIGHF